MFGALDIRANGKLRTRRNDGWLAFILELIPTFIVLVLFLCIVVGLRIGPVWGWRLFWTFAALFGTSVAALTMISVVAGILALWSWARGRQHD